MRFRIKKRNMSEYSRYCSVADPDPGSEKSRKFNLFFKKYTKIIRKCNIFKIIISLAPSKHLESYFLKDFQSIAKFQITELESDSAVYDLDPQHWHKVCI